MLPTDSFARAFPRACQLHQRRLGSFFLPQKTVRNSTDELGQADLPVSRDPNQCKVLFLSKGYLSPMHIGWYLTSKLWWCKVWRGILGGRTLSGKPVGLLQTLPQ